MTPLNFIISLYVKGNNINQTRDHRKNTKDIGGMFSTKAIVQLAKIHNVTMPITESINKLINNESNIDSIIEELLSRPLKEES